MPNQSNRKYSEHQSRKSYQHKIKNTNTSIRAQSKEGKQLAKLIKIKNIEIIEFETDLTSDRSTLTRSNSVAREEALSSGFFSSPANFTYKNKTYSEMNIQSIAPFFPTPELPGKKPFAIFYHEDGDYLVMYQEIINPEVQVMVHFKNPKLKHENFQINRIEVQTKGSDSDEQSRDWEDLFQQNALLEPAFTPQGSQEKVELKTQPELVEKLKRDIHNLVLSRMKCNPTQKQLIGARFSYTKNIPKKIGDLFADYLAKKYKKSFSEVFKDKTSQRLLNSYLSGEKILEKDEFKLETRILIKDFAQFAASLEYDAQSGSKSQEKATKYCQKAIIQNLNNVFRSLISSKKIEDTASLKIEKLWPDLILNYKFVKKTKK